MSLSKNTETVVVLGASNKPDRFAYKAICQLQDKGHQVIPVHPKLENINGLSVLASLSEVNEEIDTLTLYIGPERSKLISDDIVKLKPGRVIFNPGTESSELESKLSDASITYTKDCTLIMLSAGTF